MIGFIVSSFRFGWRLTDNLESLCDQSVLDIPPSITSGNYATADEIRRDRVLVLFTSTVTADSVVVCSHDVAAEQSTFAGCRVAEVSFMAFHFVSLCISVSSPSGEGSGAGRLTFSAQGSGEL